MRYSIALLLFAVTACHNSKLNSDVRKNLLDSRDDAQHEGGSTEDNEVAIEPTSVGGAFLICADDPSLNATSSQFGCRIEDERGEKLPGFLPKDSDVVALHLETLVPGKALRESDAFWHWTFAYQTADRTAYVVKYLGDMTSLRQREAKILDQHPQIESPATKPVAQTSPEPVVAADNSHIIFVTSLAYRPGGTNVQQFDSLQTADVICNTHAQAAKLTGSFKAVLSTSSTAARDRIALRGPIKLTNGSIIANRNVFWSTSHSLPILRDEAARTVDGGSVKVWSGTLETGTTIIAETCNDWSDSSNAAKARYGLADKADLWISDGQESCDKSLRFYCIN